jgi:hypothetical protein
MSSKIVVKDKGWNLIEENLKKIGDVEIKVGLFGSGDPENNVAARGAVHEFGVDIKVTSKMRGFFLYAFGVALKPSTRKIHIPARPFMAQSFEDGLNGLENLIKFEYIKMIEGKISIKQFFDSIGVKHTGQIKAKIIDGEYEALSGLTIQNKKSARPLVDTGIMRTSVKHKVEK